MYLHFHLDDQGLDPLATLFKRIAIQEMGHAEHLAERILFLESDVVMAVAGARWEALTAELRVRFRKAVSSRGSLTVRGWVCRKTKRRIATESELTGPDGKELAHAWATFLELKRDCRSTQRLHTA